MLHTIIEMCIEADVELSQADHYTWIFTSRVFRLALEITFLPNKHFSCKWLTSYSHKVENLISRGPNNSRGTGKFLKKNKRGNVY